MCHEQYSPEPPGFTLHQSRPRKDMVASRAHLTARALRLAMEQAIVSAVAYGRRQVTPDDLPADGLPVFPNLG